MKQSAITIDVDSLRHYRDIHGLPETPDESDPIYTVAMPRFFELLAGLPATVFLIGADAPKYAGVFAGADCEIASHSYRHDYRLTRKSPPQILEDLTLADAALEPLNRGRRIRGFRAPGYNITPAVFEAIRALGYTYDSSHLPSPQYFGARAAAIGLHTLAGRRSRSLAGDYRQFTSAVGPTLIHGVVELPMACDPLTRTPLFGTAWSMAPDFIQDTLLFPAMRKLDCAVLELHAIDLLDHTDALALAALAPYQRDLSVPAARKLRTFRRLFERMRSSSEVSTLADLAESFRSTGGAPPSPARG